MQTQLVRVTRLTLLAVLLFNIPFTVFAQQVYGDRAAAELLIAQAPTGQRWSGASFNQASKRQGPAIFAHLKGDRLDEGLCLYLFGLTLAEVDTRTVNGITYFRTVPNAERGPVLAIAAQDAVALQNALRGATQLREAIARFTQSLTGSTPASPQPTSQAISTSGAALSAASSLRLEDRLSGESGTIAELATDPRILARWLGVEPKTDAAGTNTYSPRDTLSTQFLVVLDHGNCIIRSLPDLQILLPGRGSLRTGMLRDEVQALLGAPTSDRQGALTYLTWASITPNFRLGFDPAGRLIEIRI